MLYYSTNPNIVTVSSLDQKVERIANKVMLSQEFAAARTDYYSSNSYSHSSFKKDVEDMVFRELRMNKDDRAKRLANLHSRVVNYIMRKSS